MKTVLYLIRHGATKANLARPPVLQGRQDVPLAPLGIRQAEATRDFLAIRPIEHCYASPLQRALQTATLVAEPHGLVPSALAALAECDVGRWEGLDWASIRAQEPEAYRRFQDNPAVHGFPEGESLTQVSHRVHAAIEALFQQHAGTAILVVGHALVNQCYLAGLLGLKPAQAREVTADNCGISVVVREGRKTTVSTLNAAFHLQGVAA